MVMAAYLPPLPLSAGSCTALFEAHGWKAAIPAVTPVSTACRLTPDKELEIANLGDSGVRIIRNGKVVFRTDSLQHEFNMPYQLGHPALLPVTDYASSAEVYRPAVQHNDVLVMASDGLFDNMWDEDLEEVVRRHVSPGQEVSVEILEHLAKEAASAAATNSQDKMFKSPWSVASASSGQVSLMRKLFPKGGKLDDITVIVAQLQ
jgi:serine/threonine protein phosphatase PrpC